ncbi:GNAT family protein [Peribacillus glennii]|uniref:Lipid II:glycine glycyltransferase n=1 Tax=Peribacillus glennii TaxID=2303991 RepID=A0A372LFM4_9BACI|nr:hypothetical protein [Peribacillus glennii]RFU64879.1 hypothetical protein D0466_02865 [Peribacillus glennii]
MITLTRKILNVKINTYYFADQEVTLDPSAQIHGFLHSVTPRESTDGLETLQIHLIKDKENIIQGMNNLTKRQIKQAEKKNFTYTVIERPTERDLAKFRIFYNEFANTKGTHECNSYHMSTMKLLSNRNALVLTTIQEVQKEPLCYRVYVTDGSTVMNLYTASHYRMADNSEMKKLISQANRYLVWKNICWFKGREHKIYDFGWLTEDENIRKYKLGFGGEVVTVYSGYEALSIIGRFILFLRRLSLKL